MLAGFWKLTAENGGMFERMKSMKIFDISMDIYHDMAVYKNNDSKRPSLKVIRDFSSSSAYESKLEIEMHTGTHVDAPLHMLENGSTIDKLDLNKVAAKCKVFDLTSLNEKISACDLEDKAIGEGDFVIFKTRNSFDDRFNFEFIYLDASGALLLRDRKIIGVGTDALGIERAQEDHQTHKILLESGIVIIEGLRLAEVDEGEYFLCAFPIKVNGAEAAPARAVLIKGLA